MAVPSHLHSDQPAEGDVTEPDQNSPPQGPADGPPEPPRRRNPFSDPWLRFASLFGVLAITCEILYYAVFVDTPVLKGYLETLARVAAAILHAGGFEVERNGTLLSEKGFSVQVAHGCDAIQICALITCAIVAFPAPLRGKLWGLAAGIVLLQALNQARIVSLLLIGRYRPEWFETAHLTVWPAFLIVVTVVTWLAWVRIAVPDPSEQSHES